MDSEYKIFSSIKQEDFNAVVIDAINKLIEMADNHNVERDKLIRYFAFVFSKMANVITFETYEKKPKKEGVSDEPKANN